MKEEEECGCVQIVLYIVRHYVQFLPLKLESLTVYILYMYM